MKYLALAWALAALLLFSDARTVRDYLALTGSLGLRGEAQARTPLAQTYPEFAADAQTWVRHALSLLEGHGLRLRHTDIDNAPSGREVHWNSGWAWAIAGAGAIHHAATGVPLANAIEKATLWLNPLALLVAVIVFSTWTYRRLGLLPAVLLAAAMCLHERMLEGFFPSYVDHHGLLGIAVLGTVLGAVVMMRGGREGAIFSALCGAFGMWVSAASTGPAIALTGIAAAITVSMQGSAAAARGWTFDPRAWRLWGAVGAGVSLLFYLLEYFPQHMALRLEANHPLYAIAWLGGAELVAQIGSRGRDRAALAWSILAIAALPATVIAGGVGVLSFTDPFMARLHRDYIQEFLPMLTTLVVVKPGMAFRVGVLETLPVLAAIATVAALRRRSPMPLTFATIVAATLLAMAWWQTRWQVNASAAQVCLLIVLIDAWTSNRPERMRWAVAAGVLAIIVLPGGIVHYGTARQALATRHVGSRDAAFPLARDIARQLRASQPQGEITLLASPDASTSVGYYGRFKTLGTLYWENAEGLKAAAAIFSTRDDAEAERSIRSHRVTHVAMISPGDFIEAYHRLLHPDATAEDIRSSFAGRLIAGGPVPPWLERIPYEVPPDLRALDARVLLFKVM